MRAAAPIALALALATSLLTGGCAPLRTVEAGLVLGDVAAGEGPSLYKRLTATPVREPVAYVVDGRNRRGDLYRPGDDAPPRAALALVPGAAPDGKDDRRLVAFARTLARAGFLVLVPEIERLRTMRVGSADIVDIADAIRHLASRAPEDRPVGVAAISYAAGPALLAALDARTPPVGFLLAVGGYYDMTALLAYLTTGRYRAAPDAPWQRGRPNAYGKWLFLDSNTGHVGDARDRVALAAIAGRKRRDLAADVDDLTGDLGPEGRAVYALAVNDDPDLVPALVAALPESMRGEIAALDPSRRGLAGLRARLILLHGRDDPIIPWTESAALAAAAPSGRAELFLADNLMHVDLGPGGVEDALALWRAVSRVLEERDAR